jgi:hypothetical protein
MNGDEKTGVTVQGLSEKGEDKGEVWLAEEMVSCTSIVRSRLRCEVMLTTSDVICSDRTSPLARLMALSNRDWRVWEGICSFRP